MKRHPILKTASFVRSHVQGRPRATEHWWDLFDLIVSKNPSLRRKLRRFDPAQVLCVRSANSTVTWVDEAAGMSAEARAYNSGAQGARSNLLTRQPQAPSIPGANRPVRFDGEAPGLLIDRKLAVVTSPKAQGQALRQSAALSQNGMRGMWEVPNAAEAARARRMFNKLGITNIDVRVVPK